MRATKTSIRKLFPLQPVFLRVIKQNLIISAHAHAIYGSDGKYSGTKPLGPDFPEAPSQTTEAFLRNNSSHPGASYSYWPDPPAELQIPKGTELQVLDFLRFNILVMTEDNRHFQIHQSDLSRFVEII